MTSTLANLTALTMLNIHVHIPQMFTDVRQQIYMTVAIPNHK